MRFHRLPLRCGRGHVPAHLRAVGLTPSRELVVHWWCPACREPVYVVRSLTECWRDCGDEQRWPDDAPSPAACELRPDDLAFLHSIRVKFPDDEI